MSIATLPTNSRPTPSDRPTQANRFLAIEPTGGEERMLLVAFQGQDAISRPFHYRLELLSTDAQIAPRELIGRRVGLRVGPSDGRPRWFNGYVSRFSAAGTRGEFTVYAAEVVPWLWFLSRRSNCRIFQDKTVVEILEAIFREHGFSDYDLSGVRANYRRREYCVQYRETDLEFISRLMEDEGIFYFFQHERSRHTMVLADSRLGYRPSEHETVPVIHTSGGRVRREGILRWQREGNLVPDRFVHTDYDYLAPRCNLATSENTVVDQRGPGIREIYDNTTEFADRGEGQRLARLRMEAEETGHDVVSGSSTCRGFTPGGTFTLEESERSSPDDSRFVVTVVTHRATEPASYPHSGRFGPEYENDFACIPASSTYRPARRTRRPAVFSTQTAVVVGPPGEEICTDRHGRVKVQFHWDREGIRDDRSSCWIRVAQPWAGQRFGVHFWPRIGHEVVVTFIDGDPDRPLIVASVYNADNPPPYELPANQTRSGIKTRSSREGTSENFNEIRFEDRKGQEEVYLHAERMLRTVVEADEQRSVGHDQVIRIEHDRKVEIRNDDLLDVQQTRKVSANKILLCAQEEIVLKCGSSTIKLDAAGITINGTLVRIN